MKGERGPDANHREGSDPVGRGPTRRTLLKYTAGAGIVLTAGCAGIQDDAADGTTNLPLAGAIIWHPEKCVGCQRCTLACSTYQDGKVSPALSRIKWHAEPSWVSGYDRVPYMCQQCDSPECLEACPIEGGIYVDEETGARTIDQEKCIGCQRCIEACPFDPARIQFDESEHVAVKCDLCSDREGDPACVETCSEAGGGKALEYVHQEDRDKIDWTNYWNETEVQ